MTGSSGRYTELVYQPMLEVLSYFEANGFENYILSGNSRDFMRPWVEKVYGVAPDHVIGSCDQDQLRDRQRPTNADQDAANQLHR